MRERLMSHLGPSPSGAGPLFCNPPPTRQNLPFTNACSQGLFTNRLVPAALSSGRAEVTRRQIAGQPSLHRRSLLSPEGREWGQVVEAEVQVKGGASSLWKHNETVHQIGAATAMHSCRLVVRVLPTLPADHRPPACRSSCCRPPGRLRRGKRTETSRSRIFHGDLAPL